MRKSVKKLSLNAETLSRLDRHEMGGVAGGATAKPTVCTTVNPTICTTCTHGCSGCQPCA